MHAIAEVDVGVSGGAEHDFVARCFADSRVCGEIALAEIGFGLDDAPGDDVARGQSAKEDFSQQLAGDDPGVAFVEIAGKGRENRSQKERMCMPWNLILRGSVGRRAELWSALRRAHRTSKFAVFRLGPVVPMPMKGARGSPRGRHEGPGRRQPLSRA